MGEYYTCGFPISAINKVLRCIELKKISYIVVNKSCNYEVEEKEDYKNENKYKEYYEIASKKIKIINRINAVKSFLNEILENDQMLSKLKQIERMAKIEEPNKYDLNTFKTNFELEIRKTMITQGKINPLATKISRIEEKQRKEGKI